MARDGMGQNKRTITHLLPTASSVLDSIVGLKLHLLANGHADVRRTVSHGAVAGNGLGDRTVDAVHGLVEFLGASMLGSRLVGRIGSVGSKTIGLEIGLLVGRRGRMVGAVARILLAEA